MDNQPDDVSAGLSGRDTATVGSGPSDRGPLPLAYGVLLLVYAAIKFYRTPWVLVLLAIPILFVISVVVRSRLSRRRERARASRLALAAPPPPELIDCWHLVRSGDGVARTSEMDIRPGGQMFFSVFQDGEWRTVELFYQVEGDTLIVALPGSSTPTRSHFSIEQDGALLIDSGGPKAWFTRGSKVANNLPSLAE
jgi:hypothetical protein